MLVVLGFVGLSSASHASPGLSAEQALQALIADSDKIYVEGSRLDAILAKKLLTLQNKFNQPISLSCGEDTTSCTLFLSHQTYEDELDGDSFGMGISFKLIKTKYKWIVDRKSVRIDYAG